MSAISEAMRHGRASHIAASVNFVALVAWWPSSCLHQWEPG
jgi:hypothetical protein